jgi:hypothetical protein
MTAIYGHKWASAYGEACETEAGELTVAGDTWTRGLRGVTEAQVADALEQCIVSADPWPPTLPEFRAMCFGIPSMAEVLDGIDSPNTAFNRLVWRNMDKYRYSRAPHEEARRLVRDAYQIARSHVMRGGELPEPAEPVEYHAPEEPPKCSAAQAEAHMHDIRSALGD